MVMRKLILQGLGVWLLLLGFAVINGFFRERVLEPNLGPEAAHVLATTTLAGAVFVAALLWIGTNPRGYSFRDLLAVGIIWSVLTAAFEFALGLARGRSWAELIEDYDFTRWRLFGLVLLAALVSPLIAGFAGRNARRRGETRSRNPSAAPDRAEQDGGQ